jgi:broad specificity phosphatase PhoE
LQATLPSDDVVMCVSHGDTIWKLFAAVVGIDSDRVSHGTMNTSLSSFKIEADGEVSIDFYNRTPHLRDAADDKYATVS